MNKYLQKASQQNENAIGKVKAVIGPHAGFRYSGPVAAWSYKYLERLK